ncbi:MAG TPA: hypothetical protein VNQ97_15695, partial [Burkholderiaceae bacterium]|nr:hypothetical protein [Burkholderiaceae bacterium]
MPPPYTLPDPWYYLTNFEFALDWIAGRYADLLRPDELAFMHEFSHMPRPSRALLVRMMMRKGDLFRLSKLRYAEIGASRDAVQALVACGWVDASPLIGIDDLCTLLTRNEVALLFSAELDRAGLLSATKTTQRHYLQTRHIEAHAFTDWLTRAESLLPLTQERSEHAAQQGAVLTERAKDLPARAALAVDHVYKVMVGPLCERFRLMFFGNMRQDWTEFVLADLGMFRYEPVPFPLSSRAFQTSREIDDYLHLHRCKEKLEQHSGCDELAGILDAVTPDPYD